MSDYTTEKAQADMVAIMRRLETETGVRIVSLYATWKRTVEDKTFGRQKVSVTVQSVDIQTQCQC